MQVSTFIHFSTLGGSIVQVTDRIDHACRPVSHYWKAATEHECMAEGPVILSCAVFNFLSDFWLVVMPIPTLWKLTLPPRQKIVLIVLLGLGGV